MTNYYHNLSDPIYKSHHFDLLYYYDDDMGALQHPKYSSNKVNMSPCYSAMVSQVGKCVNNVLLSIFC